MQGRELSVVMDISGARPLLANDGNMVELVALNGEQRWRYGAPSVIDADGRLLPSQLQVRGNQIVLNFNDEGVVYPLTIDPLIQTAELSADNSSNDEEYIDIGHAVDLENQIAVVGLLGYRVNGRERHGMAYVMHYDNYHWQLYARLSASDGDAYDNFGYAVTISGDTIYIGAPGHDVSYGGMTMRDVGAVYRFVKPAEE